MKKGEKTRRRIMEEARKLVAEKGYSAVSTREIAEEAGVSEATIFKYFRTKDSLLLQIVRDAINGFYEYSVSEALPGVLAHNRGRPVKSLLRELLLERLSFFEKNNQALKVILQEMMINEEVKKLFKEKVWAEMVSFSDGIFDRGKAAGEIKGIDNRLLRRVIFGMFFFNLFFERELDLNVNEKGSQTAERCTLAEEVDIMVEIIFDGIKGEE